MLSSLEQLAIENNGAIQVEESLYEVPLMVFLGGPIKYWWNDWNHPQQEEYFTWRDAVQAACIKAGFMTYAPHRALRGSWNENAQHINNAAIKACHIFIDMTPPGIPAPGTMAERAVAFDAKRNVINVPPSTIKVLNNTIHTLQLLEPEALGRPQES